MCSWRAFGQSCWRRIRDTWKLRHHTSSTEQNYFVFYHWLKSWTSVSQMNYRTPEDARVKTRSAILSSRKIIVIIAFCCVGVFYHLKQRFSLIIAHLCVAEFKGHSRVPVFVIIFSGGLQLNLLASQLNKLCLWQLFTFSWFHLVPKIISLTSYSSRRTSNSVEIFVWIRFHHFVWDFKLNFKFH